jgi:hypothetical protein
MREEIRDAILNSLYRKYGSRFITPLGKLINVEPKAIKSFAKGHPVEVHTLESLRRAASMKMDLIENSIIQIDRIEEPSLPLNFDCKEGARLDAGIFNEGRARNRCVEYHNKDKDVIKIILKCSQKIISRRFEPSMSVDKRVKCFCLYFPPIFAKHYKILGITEKSKKELQSGIPSYIMNNKEFQRAWLHGTLSEEGCIYPFVQNIKGKLFLSPVIQWNRNSKVNLNINFSKRDLYKKDIQPLLVRKLKNNLNPLIRNEASILRDFDIKINPMFSRLHKSKKGIVTAVYSIHIRGFKNCEKWLNNIGFEMKRQRKQLVLLLNYHGNMNKNDIQEVLIKFYSMIPPYLRDKRKIISNKWLEEYQKRLLVIK